jgi:hypothetical protein
MKPIPIMLILGLLLQVPVFAQGTVDFNINFGGNPPPHTLGNPNSGARLMGDSFYAILYLDTITPISGSIQELDGGTFTTVFQFTNSVFASYPGGGPALDYEDSWQLTNAQLQDLLTGQWYAKVTYNDASYMGQITPVPEPSSITFLSAGLVMVSACLYRSKMSRNTTLEPTVNAPCIST